MTDLTCHCGQTRITLSGPPILAVDCCCTSCAEAARRLERLPGAGTITDAIGATPFVLYRKDRIAVPAPLRSFRLTGESTTRRLVAPCCNTPVALEFKGGHWLSLYAALWPPGTAPAAHLRTMTANRPDRDALPADKTNARYQTAGFMWALLKAWVAMGLRSPKIATDGEVHA